MLRDEVIDAQTPRARAAVLVVALEVDRVLALHDLARLRDQEAVHFGRVRRPGVEDQAITVPAVGEGHRAAAFDPGLGFFLRGHGPAHESLNLILAVDREVIVLAIDLAGEDARPVAEPQLAKAGLVIRWLTARPNAMYGSFARNTLSFSRGAIGAAVIWSWKGAIAASSADDDACPAAGRLGTAHAGWMIWMLPPARCDRHHTNALSDARGSERFQIRRAGDDVAMVTAKRIAGVTRASTRGRCRGEPLRLGGERRKVADPVGLRSAAIGLNCVNQGQD